MYAIRSYYDLAFKRSSFIMNGGDSGSKGITIAYTGNNGHFYDTSGEALVDVFNAATARITSYNVCYTKLLRTHSNRRLSCRRSR